MLLKNYYQLNNKSSVNLVIEYHCKNSKFIPNNIYFELEKTININDLFIKNELIEFLSILN